MCYAIKSPTICVTVRVVRACCIGSSVHVTVISDSDLMGLRNKIVGRRVVIKCSLGGWMDGFNAEKNQGTSSPNRNYRGLNQMTAISSLVVFA